MTPPPSDESVPGAPRIHCPKCATPLHTQQGRLACAPGGMQLSKNLEELLLAAVAKQGAVTADSDVPPIKKPPAWFCPRCAEPMGERKLELSCPNCGCVVSPLMHHKLVELHPHVAWPPMELGPRRTLQIWRARVQ